MLLKSPKKSRLRLLAGAAAVTAFTAASLAATASYGFADEKADKKEARVATNRSASRTVIEADKGETLKIDGVKNANKIDIKDEDGKRTIRIYDKNDKLISENVYGPGEDMPFGTVKFTGKDGAEKEIHFQGNSSDDHDFLFVSDDAAVVPFPPSPPDVEKRVMIVRADGNAFRDIHHSDCAGVESDGNVALFEWKSEDGDEDVRSVTHDIICLDGEDADPKKRAEALRKAITMMEADAKKDAERRKEHIAKMKDALKKAEKEAKKK